MPFNEIALECIEDARQSGLLLSGQHAPPLVSEGNHGAKSYHVRGSVFEVYPYYELLSAVGYGAYGVVCAAVDLRLSPSSTFYNERLIEVEEGGSYVIRRHLDGGATRHYKLRNFLDTAVVGKCVYVPDLYTEAYKRRTLAKGNRSPFVAIKKVPHIFQDLVDGRRILREVKVLQYLVGHPNIIRLLDVSCSASIPSGDPRFEDIYMTTELMDTDMSALLKSSQEISVDQLRFMMYQVVKALVYTHSSGVIHRDLKPGNILLNGDCDVKICDFGLARGGVPLHAADGRLRRREGSGTSSIQAEFAQFQCHITDRDVCGAHKVRDAPLFSTGTPPTDQAGHSPTAHSLTDYVVTRYYRAPELLVMARYNHAVDMWAVGCILAEMFLRRPLFAGSNYLSQLTLILETPGLRGIPQTREGVKALFDGGEEGKHFIEDVLFSPQASSLPPAPQNPIHLQSLFHNALFGPSRDIPVEAGVLVAKLLSFDPRKRPTALEALRDPFFRNLYDPRDEIIRCSNLNSCAEEISDLAAYQASHDCVVVEEQPPFAWEFDHRITDEKSLRNLFLQEIKYFAAMKKQLGVLSSPLRT